MAANLEIENTSNSFPKRRLVLHFESPTYNFWVNKEDNFLQVKVRYEHSQGGLGMAEIEIFNLPEEEIIAMTNYAYAAKENPFNVKIYAGYEKIGEKKTFLSLVYEGSVLYSRPVTARTDRQFKILAMEKYAEMNSVISYSSSVPKTFLEIAGEILEEKGFFVDIGAMQTCQKYLPKETYEQNYGYKINSYSFFGKVRDFLQFEVRKANKLQFIQDGGRIKFYPSSDDWSQILNLLSDSDAALKTIDAENSDGITMVGIPSPNYYAVNLRILFNNSFLAGDNFVLKSHFFQKANGRYQAIKCSYSLDSRSQNFYMDIYAIRSTGKSNKSSLYTANNRNAADNLLPANEVKTAKSVAEKISTFSQNCIPAIVKKYDAKTNIAEVKPAVKILERLPDGESGFLELPTWSVPVERPGSGGFALVFPIKEGTTGWLYGADRNTQNYLESDLSEPENAADLRVNLWEFGHFVPDVIKGFVISEEDSESISIQSMDSNTRVVLSPDGKAKIIAPSELEIKTPIVSVDGDVFVSGDVMAGTVSLRTHQHTYTQPSSNAGSLSGKPKE